MTEKHFEDVEQYHLTAAQVGIHASRWTKVTDQTSPDKVRELMLKNQYDVVPVESPEGVTHYYTTLKQGDFSGDIEKRAIQAEDKLYYLSHIEDVINLFQQHDRRFFFLWDYQQVLGLISEVNLQSTAVSVYLYALSNNLEVALSQLFLLAYTEEEFIDVLESNINNGPCHPNDKGKQLRKLKKQIKEHGRKKRKNQHLHFIETQGLSALLGVILHQKWLTDYSDEQLSEAMQSVKKVRDYISHPVRSDISTAQILTFINNTRQLIQMIKTAELNVHYRKTHFKVKGNEQPIEIDKPLPESLVRLCVGKSWCFITAFNPASRPLDSAINTVLNQQLKQDLEALGLQVFEGQGESTTDKDYPPELSFWVPGISRKDAEKLGQKYGQNAIVYGEPEGNAELVKFN